MVNPQLPKQQAPANPSPARANLIQHETAKQRNASRYREAERAAEAAENLTFANFSSSDAWPESQVGTDPLPESSLAAQMDCRSYRWGFTTCWIM